MNLDNGRTSQDDYMRMCVVEEQAANWQDLVISSDNGLFHGRRLRNLITRSWDQISPSVIECLEVWTLTDFFKRNMEAVSCSLFGFSTQIGLLAFSKLGITLLVAVIWSCSWRIHFDRDDYTAKSNAFTSVGAIGTEGGDGKWCESKDCRSRKSWNIFRSRACSWNASDQLEQASSLQSSVFCILFARYG